MKELVLSGCSVMADYVKTTNYSILDRKQEYLTCAKVRGVEMPVWEYMEPFPLALDIVSNHYDMTPIDLSYVGSGNRQIFNKLYQYITLNHEKIGLVVACWSSFSRIDFDINNIMVEFQYKNNPYHTMVYLSYDENEITSRILREKYELWKMLTDFGFISPERDIDEFYRYSTLLDTICKYYDIECVQAAAIHDKQIADDEKSLKYFIDHPLYNKINKMNFYKWPIFPELGGNVLRPTDFKYNITMYDFHPNEEGHKEMARRLIEFIDERGFI